MVPRTGPLSASFALAIRSWYQRGKSSARGVSTRAMTAHPMRRAWGHALGRGIGSICRHDLPDPHAGAAPTAEPEAPDLAHLAARWVSWAAHIGGRPARSPTGPAGTPGITSPPTCGSSRVRTVALRNGNCAVLPTAALLPGVLLVAGRRRPGGRGRPQRERARAARRAADRADTGRFGRAVPGPVSTTSSPCGRGRCLSPARAVGAIPPPRPGRHDLSFGGPTAGGSGRGAVPDRGALNDLQFDHHD